MNQNSREDSEEVLLIRRCQKEDTRAFDELIRRYQNKVYGMALGMLGEAAAAEEMAEEAFVRAYRSIKSFRAEAKFSTWLTAIVINLCRQHRRWWARRKKVIAGSLDAPIETEEGTLQGQVADKGPSPEEKAMSFELKQQLYAAVRTLDHQSRAMVVMRDIQGCSYEEIAVTLKCPEGTVKSRLNRARLRLKELLKDKLKQ